MTFCISLVSCSMIEYLVDILRPRLNTYIYHIPFLCMHLRLARSGADGLCANLSWQDCFAAYPPVDRCKCSPSVARQSTVMCAVSHNFWVFY